MYFYWSATAFDCYTIRRSCTECGKDVVELWKFWTKLTFLRARAPLTYIATDILGEVVRPKRGYRDLLVITDRFSKSVRTVPVKRITVAAVARAFVFHWVFIYIPPVTLLSGNGSQFNLKFFQDMCRIFGIRNKLLSTYHSQCNGKIGVFNSTIPNDLRAYFADYITEWDLYMDAIKYAYKTQVHQVTNLAPFELVLSRIPPPVAIEARINISVYPSTRLYRDSWKDLFKNMVSVDRKVIRKPQEAYKQNIDAKIR